MLEKIYKNNVAFYEMVEFVSLLGNSDSPLFEDDAKKIIDFVGKVYGLDESLIGFCKDQIINELSMIQTEEDANTYRSLKQQGKGVANINNPLLRFKYNAINTIIDYTKGDNQLKKTWFDYSYPNDYVSFIRYSEIKSSSSVGLIKVNKMAAVMDYLGIGTEVNKEGAIRQFKQCMFWADENAPRYLAFIAKEEKNEEKAKVYDELSSLSSYINDGITVLPKEEKEKVTQETSELFAIITSTKHDIIRRFNVNKIDYSFVEVMMDEEIPYATKLRYINNYRTFEWSEATNSSVVEAPHMGFKKGE